MNVRLLLFLAFCLSAGRAGAATCQYAVTASGFSDYVLNGVADPAITLFRGFTYRFQVNASSTHPFWIKSVQGNTSANAYNDGVTGNGTGTGLITFAVPMNAPDTLFYNCQFHAAMAGQFNIIDPPPVEIINLYFSGGELVLESAANPLLNMQVEALRDLVSGAWEKVTIVTNAVSGGTNLTSQIVTNDVFVLRLSPCCD